MTRYYDRQGNPLPDPHDDMEGWLREWARLLEDDEYKRVALTEIGDVRISTVWLGLDHNWMSWDGSGPILIFETMVFGGPLDQEQDRYSTEAQALAGHDQMVAKVREAGAQRDGSDCICGEINARHCPVHNDGRDGAE